VPDGVTLTNQACAGATIWFVPLPIVPVTDCVVFAGMVTELTGVGPGEGTIKFVLPDAHTDFIFAVAGEEFGLAACAFLIVVFGVIVIRALNRALAEKDHFIQLAAAGLAVLFGLQAFINMAVNLNLIPAKGMTLPFVSYGGSSMLALALTAGMLLALTRRRPTAPARR